MVSLELHFLAYRPSKKHLLKKNCLRHHSTKTPSGQKQRQYGGPWLEVTLRGTGMNVAPGGSLYSFCYIFGLHRKFRGGAWTPLTGMYTRFVEEAPLEKAPQPSACVGGVKGGEAAQHSTCMAWARDGRGLVTINTGSSLLCSCVAFLPITRPKGINQRPI